MYVYVYVVMCVRVKRETLSPLSSSRTYVYAYTHVYMHTCIRKCIHTHAVRVKSRNLHRAQAVLHGRGQVLTGTHTCIHTHKHTYIHVHTHAYTHTYIHTYTHIRKYVSTYCTVGGGCTHTHS